MTSFQLLAGVKASAVAVCVLAAVRLLPLAWLNARRQLALAGMWSLLVVPWISFQAPVAHGALPHVSLPEIPTGALMSGALAAMWASGGEAASSKSLSAQAKSAAKRRTPAERSAAAKKAARTRKAGGR